MKVKDLIEKLQELNPEGTIQIPDLSTETWLCDKIEVIDYWDRMDTDYVLVGKL